MAFCIDSIHLLLSPAFAQHRRQATHHVQPALGLHGKGQCLQHLARPGGIVRRISHVSRSSGQENQDSKDEFAMVGENDASRDVLLRSPRYRSKECVVHEQYI